MNDIFNILGKILHYIFNLKLFDLPLHIAYMVVVALVGYGMGAFFVGFPISIYEELTKKEVKAKEKIKHHARLFFSIVLGIRLLYELATKH